MFAHFFIHRHLWIFAICKTFRNFDAKREEEREKQPNKHTKYVMSTSSTHNHNDFQLAMFILVIFSWWFFSFADGLTYTQLYECCHLLLIWRTISNICLHLINIDTFGVIYWFPCSCFGFFRQKIENKLIFLRKYRICMVFSAFKFIGITINFQFSWQFRALILEVFARIWNLTEKYYKIIFL